MLVASWPGIARAQGAGDPILQAPYQIDAVQRAFRSYDPQPLLTAVVGLGRAPDAQSPEAGIPLPDADEFQWMTILGTDGFAHASLQSIERRCEHLCGDELQECHWVGIYALAGSDEDFGVPVGAVPGRLELTEYVGAADLAAGDDGIAGHDDGMVGSIDEMATLPAVTGAIELLWDPTGGQGRVEVASWDAPGGSLEAVVRGEWGDSPLVGEDCRAAAHEWLLAIDCGGFALLASGGRPLLLSQADYNDPKVEPLARFVYGGSRHYVVRFGAKAQDVVGLVSGEPAGWRARFQPRDWALLC